MEVWSIAIEVQKKTIDDLINDFFQGMARGGVPQLYSVIGSAL